MNTLLKGVFLLTLFCLESWKEKPIAVGFTLDKENSTVYVPIKKDVEIQMDFYR